MNLYRLAVIALRVLGIDWILNATLTSTYLPGDFLRYFHQPSGYLQLRAGSTIVGSLLHAVFQIVEGAALIGWSKPCARFLTRSLKWTTPARPLHGVWPPPSKDAGVPPMTLQPLFGYDYASSIHGVAVLLLGILGVLLVFDTAPALVSIGGDIIGLKHHHDDYLASQYRLGASMTVVRSLMVLGMGLYLLLLPELIAKRVTNDLVQDAEAEQQMTETSHEGIVDADVNTVR